MKHNLNLNELLSRLDKTLGALVIASVFSLIFIVSHRAIFDLDIWLHLKAGEYILQNKIIPTFDIFSFTLNSKPWVDHEWLFQALCALVYNKWSAEGLIMLQTYVILMSFFVLFLIGRRQICSYLEVGVFLFVTAYACLSRFNIRPEIFSLLFFSLYLYLLRCYIDKKIIWLLLLVQILWVNIHGYFFLGPLSTFLFLASEFLRRKCAFLPRSGREELVLSDAGYGRLQKFFLLSLLACLFNPQGVGGLLYPAVIFKDMLFGTNSIFFKHIQELRPTFVQLTYTGNFYYLISAFCFSFLALNFRRLKLAEIFLSVFFFIFGLTVRNIAFFAFSAYMVTISYLSPTLERASEHVRIETSLRQALYFLIKYCLAIYFIFWIGLRIDKIAHEGYYDFKENKFSSLLFGVQENNYPKGAVDFLLECGINTNLFNDFNSGAYLIGKAYPKIKVFIDGRTEMYGREFFAQYLETMRGNAVVTKRVFERYNIGAVLLSLTSENLPFLIGYLYKNPDWKLVFFDETGVVFLKNIAQNQELISKYGADFSKYHPPAVNLKAIGLRRVYPWPYLKRASLFVLMHEESAALEEAKEALRIMPYSVKAHQLLGKIYLNNGSLQDALENLRAALIYSPRNLEALVDLGSCLKELKDDKSAIQALKGAIGFNRTYAPAYYELGRVYLSLAEEDKALGVLKKAVKYAPGEPAYHFELGSAYLEKTKKSPDISYINKAQAEFAQASKLNSRFDIDLTQKIRLKCEEAKHILEK